MAGQPAPAANSAKQAALQNRDSPPETSPDEKYVLVHPRAGLAIRGSLALSLPSLLPLPTRAGTRIGACRQRPLRVAAVRRSASRLVDEPHHFRGQARIELHLLAGHGMFQAERLGVQGDPLVRPIAMPGGGGLVARVAQHGMSGLGKVHADLVSPAGFQPDCDQRRVGQAFEDLIVRHRQLPDLAIVGRVAVQGFVGRQVTAELARGRGQMSGDDRHILPLRLPRSELIPQAVLDLSRLAKDQQPGDAAVQAMYGEDACARVPTCARTH